MVFRILEHDGRTHSLEFDETDLPVLEAFLDKNFADIKIQKQTIHSDVVLAGIALIFYNEWEDPCLISMDEEGGHLLDFIFNGLSASEP